MKWKGPVHILVEVADSNNNVKEYNVEYELEDPTKVPSQVFREVIANCKE